MSIEEIDLKGRLDQAAANQAAKVAYDHDYFQAVLDAGKNSFDRSRSAAELVQKSATGIGTLYAAVLGVSFSVSDRRLPLRGLVPAVFVGLAIVLSTVYVAYITRVGDLTLGPLHTSPPERLQRRLNNYFLIITDAVQRRSYWLRASVVALGLGIVLLPAPFITFHVITPPALHSQYPWPSPPKVVPDRTPALEAIVLQAQVAEVASERRREQLEQAEPDPAAWAVVTLIGIFLVMLVPMVMTTRILRVL
jgi:hypothetical protein